METLTAASLVEVLTAASLVETLTAASLVEIGLHVVAVDLGAAEDDGLVHAVLVDGAQRVLALQQFHRLRQHLCKHITSGQPL